MDRLCVFGLGYVGREVATLAANNGFGVSIVDTDTDVISAIREGSLLNDVEITEATTKGQSTVDKSDVIISAVPTPLGSSYGVDLSALESVTETVSRISPGHAPLYVVESTIPPGTITDVVVPILESNGLTIGDDIYVAHVPERISPGSDTWELANIPRVAGAVTDEGLDRTVAFYEKLLDAAIHSVPSPAVAEASKIVENTYRDINIAYVNEIALALDKLNIDTKAVLDAAETKPFGFTRFSPGVGVGGHCIPIDPYFLIRESNKNGFNNRFLKYAREINDQMPHYIAQKTVEELNAAEILPNGAGVVLLGQSFKPNVSDTRNSPYFELRAELERFGVSIETYDPHVPGESTVNSPYVDADAVLVVTAHDEFRALSFERLASMGVSIVIDGRNLYDVKSVESHGLRYVGVGR